MQNEKEQDKIKKYIATSCGPKAELTNIDLFVQALTNYCTQHKQMLESAQIGVSKAKKKGHIKQQDSSPQA
jgi:hypothetical protein